ncbi:hypothetical protein AAG570_008120 [Ranatra chinensis]|uniref:Nicastrin n=1 Tax=Ranatra chinensis TaxID=642074 RepID=A0ABD0XV54_9HEMI
MMQAVVSGEVDSGTKAPLPLYVGVAHSPNRLTTLTGLILASLTSPVVNVTSKECTNKQDLEKFNSLIWMNGDSGAGECINTTLKFSPAVSPAFQIEDYDWSSGKYSTWTESVWQDISVVMFMKPSRTQEFVTLAFGLSTMFISIGIIYWITHYGQNMFLSQ